MKDYHSEALQEGTGSVGQAFVEAVDVKSAKMRTQNDIALAETDKLKEEVIAGDGRDRQSRDRILKECLRIATETMQRLDDREYLKMIKGAMEPVLRPPLQKSLEQAIAAIVQALIEEAKRPADEACQRSIELNDQLAQKELSRIGAELVRRSGQLVGSMNTEMDTEIALGTSFGPRALEDHVPAKKTQPHRQNYKDIKKPLHAGPFSR